MSGKVDPEAAKPTTVQSYDMSDRNPAVAEWGEGGGQVEAPAKSDSRVPPEGKAVSPEAGLKY